MPGGEMMRFHNIPVRDIMQEAVRYGGVIVDVRTEEEFLRGHIPMAVNVPLSDIQYGNYNLPKIKCCSHIVSMEAAVHWQRDCCRRQDIR